MPVEKFPFPVLTGKHLANPVTVLLVSLRRNRRPRILQSEREEDLIPYDVGVGLSCHSANDFTQNKPTRCCVIPGRRSDDPVFFKRRMTNPADRLLPDNVRPTRFNVSKSTGVSQQMSQGDLAFASGCKFGDECCDLVIKPQRTLLPEL